MHAAIQTVKDQRRGCGWRKKGGLYLMSDAPARECGLFPLALTVCPCCGVGIKPSRGWTWIQPKLLRAGTGQCTSEATYCQSCPMWHLLVGQEEQPMGLIWIGVRHYPTVAHFQREATLQGISRRIKSVPHDFVLGETWVALAHRHAIQEPLEMGQEPEFTPGIFRIFKPRRVEVVVGGDESDEEIEALLDRGLTPVVVERVLEQNGHLDLEVEGVAHG